MQIQKVNRTDAEKIFINIHNVEGNTATTGLGIRYVGGAAAEIVSTDGVQTVLLNADSAMSQLAGIATRDIPDDGFGQIQSWGFVDSILISAEADKTVGVTGIENSFLKKGGTIGSFTSTQTPEGMSTFAFKHIQAWTTVDISGGLNYCSGFIRAV